MPSVIGVVCVRIVAPWVGDGCVGRLRQRNNGNGPEGNGRIANPFRQG